MLGGSERQSTLWRRGTAAGTTAALHPAARASGGVGSQKSRNTATAARGDTSSALLGALLPRQGGGVRRVREASGRKETKGILFLFVLVALLLLFVVVGSLRRPADPPRAPPRGQGADASAALEEP